jgi:elongation factor Ts
MTRKIKKGKRKRLPIKKLKNNMAKIDPNLLRRLRESTGAPIMRVKKVLEDVGGDEKKAQDILKKEGFEKMEKRLDRVTAQGLIESYVHHTGKVVSVVELLCETDFVARNEMFKKLAHDLALQLASSPAEKVESFLKQDYIKDPSLKVADLVKDVITKTGENIKVGRIYRLEIGK